MLTDPDQPLVGAAARHGRGGVHPHLGVRPTPGDVLQHSNCGRADFGGARKHCPALQCAKA